VARDKPQLGVSSTTGGAVRNGVDTVWVKNSDNRLAGSDIRRVKGLSGWLGAVGGVENFTSAVVNK
jgi:hypothetical protein